MNNKVYARQVCPEFQESPLMLDTYCDCLPEYIENGSVVIYGNGDYKQLLNADIEQLVNNLYGLAYDAEYMHDYFYTISEMLICNSVEKANGKQWSSKEKATIYKALRRYYNNEIDDDTMIILMLNLIYSGHYDVATMRGCCQRDWQYIYYNTDLYNSDDIRQIEQEYFNTGTEWIIHDEDKTPEQPDDINGYSIYCYGWSYDDIRLEIASVTGADIDDIILYSVNGHTSITDYEEVA